MFYYQPKSNKMNFEIFCVCHLAIYYLAASFIHSAWKWRKSDRNILNVFDVNVLNVVRDSSNVVGICEKNFFFTHKHIQFSSLSHITCHPEQSNSVFQ